METERRGPGDLKQEILTAVIIAATVTVLVAAAGPGLGRRLPPAVATRVLVAASVLVAGQAGRTAVRGTFAARVWR